MSSIPLFQNLELLVASRFVPRFRGAYHTPPFFSLARTRCYCSDFYDPDDEGFERLVDDEQLPLVESEAEDDVVGSVDVGAAVQNFRGR